MPFSFTAVYRKVLNPLAGVFVGRLAAAATAGWQKDWEGDKTQSVRKIRFNGRSPYSR